MIPNLKAQTPAIARPFSVQATVRKQARIVVLEDDKEIRETLISLLQSDGYYPANIKGYASVEEMDAAISAGTGFPLNTVDLFSVDHKLAGDIRGLAFIKTMLEKNTLLEKHRFVLVSANITMAQARAICPLIYDVLEKPVTSKTYFESVENALCETFRLRDSVGMYAQTPLAPLQYIQPTIPLELEQSYQKTMQALNPLFRIIEKYLLLNNKKPTTLTSIKTKLHSRIDTLILNAATISIPTDSPLRKGEIRGTENLTALALRGMLQEMGNDSPGKNQINMKRIIDFLQETPNEKELKKRTEIIPDLLLKIISWYTIVIEKKLITNEFTLKSLGALIPLLERLTAILYVSPEQCKEFQTTIMRDLIKNLEQMTSKYLIPHHQFSENGKIAQALIDFTRKIF